MAKMFTSASLSHKYVKWHTALGTWHMAHGIWHMAHRNDIHKNEFQYNDAQNNDT